MSTAAVPAPVNTSDDNQAKQPQAQAQTNVFAVHGADPDVLAYAMAKYSRSALSM